MKIPYHLGIIMDGNRRWAKLKGLAPFEGHKQGLKTFEKIARYCQEKGVKILTVFAFSTENWNRPSREVNFLMKLFARMISKQKIKQLQKRKVKIRFIGQINKFPKILQKKIKEAETLTKHNKAFLLNVALSYGGRADIIKAIRHIVARRVPLGKIDDNLVSSYLWTKNLPDPDLIIRTGGEKRISNFLIWQGAYSELYFSNKFWPDFSEKDLEKAILDYSRRQRRFGR